MVLTFFCITLLLLLFAPLLLQLHFSCLSLEFLVHTDSSETSARRKSRNLQRALSIQLCSIYGLNYFGFALLELPQGTAFHTTRPVRFKIICEVIENAVIANHWLLQKIRCYYGVQMDTPPLLPCCCCCPLYCPAAAAAAAGSPPPFMPPCCYCCCPPPPTAPLLLLLPPCCCPPAAAAADLIRSRPF